METAHDDRNAIETLMKFYNNIEIIVIMFTSTSTLFSFIAFISFLVTVDSIPDKLAMFSWFNGNYNTVQGLSLGHLMLYFHSMTVKDTKHQFMFP